MILRRYQAAVILLLGVVYFINLPGYTSKVDSALPKVFTIHLFVALLLPVAYRVVCDRRSLNSVLANPLLYWCGGYLLVACLWFPFSGHSAVEEQAFKYRVLMVIYVVGFLLLFSETWSVALARKAIVAASLIAVALNLIDFITPGLFVSVDEAFASPGRAAGLYINPNRAGAAIAIGFLLGAGILPGLWRVAYMALLLAGIAITFSRAAILALVVGIFFAWRAGVLPLRHVLAAGAILSVAALAAIGTLLSDSSWTEVVDIDSLSGRVSVFTNPLGARDRSADERIMVARVALEYLGEQPILGNGIGSTDVWRHYISTHNMYLYYLVEYGIIGLFIFPALVWASVWGARAPARPWLLGYALALLVVGAFTHNAAGEPYLIISYALAASMSALSRQTLSEHSNASLPLPLTRPRM